MNINNLLSLKSSPNNRLPEGKPIIQFNETIFKKKVLSLNGTSIFDELTFLNLNTDRQNAALLILSEPKESDLSESNLLEFINDYQTKIQEAEQHGLPIIHLVSNSKWFNLFEELLNDKCIGTFMSRADYNNISFDKLNQSITILEDYIMPSSLQYYSNNTNKSIMIDLTMADTSKKNYILDFDKLLKKALTFEEVLLLINEETYLPFFDNKKVKVIKNINSDIIHEYTNVFVYTNKPYSHESISKVLYYAANSKVVFTNYNYSINNVIPSVILNLNKNDYEFSPLNDMDAFNVINENRNNVMYNLTLLNVLDNIHNDIFGEKIINKVDFNSDHKIPIYNNYFNISIQNASDFEVQFNSNKYDIEQTLFFPILFLGKNGVEYEDSYIIGKNSEMDFYIDYIHGRPKKQKNFKRLSIIIPIHNNGKYLKYKCYLSIKKLSCYEDLEIIFVDDGSSDCETMRIIEDILTENSDILYKRFDKGSGSASRPRNVGIDIASTDYITFLDPDNEAISDGFSILLQNIIKDKELDMVIGNIVREDNIKRNEINYYKKAIKANKEEIIDDTRKILIETNLTVQSIQALIVKKNILKNNNLRMVEGAAGQDTLFFQELFLKCNKVRIINQMVHSYYAYVEGSVTNTVTHKFFEKFYKVELQRIKFLERENLIDVYMSVKFNFYFRNWYLKKFNEMINITEKDAARVYLDKILKLYEEHRNNYDKINY